jgi:hypothetical protein
MMRKIHTSELGIIRFNRVAVGICSFDDLKGLSSFGDEVLRGRKWYKLGNLGKNNEKGGGSWDT